MVRSPKVQFARPAAPTRARTPDPGVLGRARGRPNRAQSEALSREIVDAAMELFLQKGVAGTAMEDIASACRTTRRSIASRFPTKQDLLLAAARQYGQEVRTGLGAIIGERAVAPIERLNRALRFIFGRAINPRSRGVMMVYAAEAASCPALAEQLSSDETSWEQQLETLVAEAQANGGFANFESRDVASAAIATMLSYPCIISLLHAAQPRDDQAELYFGRMWRLILAMA